MAAEESHKDHNPSDGTQWEIGKSNLANSSNELKSTYDVDANLADEYTHHAWQELSNVKCITSVEEAKAFFKEDSKNLEAWARLGVESYLTQHGVTSEYAGRVVENSVKNVANNSNKEVAKAMTLAFLDFIEVNDDGNTFKKPMSSLSVAKAALNAIANNVDNEISASKSNDKSTKDGVPKKEEDDNRYDKYLKACKITEDDERAQELTFSRSKDKDIDKLLETWGNYGVSWSNVTVDDSGTYILTVPKSAFVNNYNDTKAIIAAKRKVREAQATDIRNAKMRVERAKALKAQAKRTNDARISNYKTISKKNDNIRKTKAEIEQKRLEDEKNIKAQQEALNERLKNKNKEVDEEYDSWLAANPNASEEDKANARSKIEKQTDAKYAKEQAAIDKSKTKAQARSNSMNSKIESAPKVDTTVELYNSQQAEAKKGSKGGKFDKLLKDSKGLLAKGMDLFNAAKSGNLANALNIGKGKGLDGLLNSAGLKNNPKLMAAMSKFGLRTGLLDNVLGDLVNIAGAYAGDLLDSAIKLGLSKLMSITGDYADKGMLKTVKALAYTGGDPNYNNTFLKVILEADYPECLKYLDEYNGVTQYTLDSNEYMRGRTAAKNGCHKVAKHICDELYKTYKTCKTTSDSTADANLKKENGIKAENIAAEIRKVFNLVVAYSYGSFTVNDLMKWLADDTNGGFASIINPSMLGADDPTCNGKYKITDSEIDVLAPIVSVTEVDGESAAGTFSFSATSGMKINGKGSNNSVDGKNVSKTKQYIDLRNINIKKIYAYLVTVDPEVERMSNKPFHDRLKYPVMTAWISAMNSAMNTLLKSDTFKDLAHIVNNMVAATIHNTISLMDKNHLILRASDTKTPVLKDEDGEPPEFVDYTKSTVTFNANGGKITISKDGEPVETTTQTFTNGKTTNITRYKVTKEGYKFLGWATSSNAEEIEFDNGGSFKKSSNFTLYAVWKVVDSDSDDSNEDETIPKDSEINEDENKTNINNNRTSGDLKNDSEKTILGCVKTPEEFVKLGLDFKNFKVIDTYGKDQTAVQEELSSILAKNSKFMLVNEKSLLKYNSLMKAHTDEHRFMMYCDEPEIYNKQESDGGLTSTEKESVMYTMIAYHLVVEYSKNATIEAMSNWYGVTREVITYKTDDSGNFVLDENNEKIPLTSRNANIRDENLTSELKRFAEACIKIRALYEEAFASIMCTVSYDLCGFESDELIRPNTITVQSYSTLSDNEPDEPSVDGFVFRGWATDPEGKTIWDFENDVVIQKTLTLYAIFEKITNYIKIAKMPASKNPSLKFDIYGTVDETSMNIHFNLHESEMDENERYYVDIILPIGCTMDEDYSVSKAHINLVNGEDFVVTDPNGDERCYSFVLNQIEEDSTNISYITDGGSISEDFLDKMSYNSEEFSEFPTATKDGFTFKGWSKSQSDETVVESISKSDISNTLGNVLYAVWEETLYNIEYFDKNELPFSGTHKQNYVTKASYSKAYSLDKPTRDGYVFLGYFEDKECVLSYVRHIYKYSTSSDRTLYAYWMDENEYASFTGGVTIDNTKIDLSKTIFYTSMITASCETWAITGTGFNIYGTSGSRIRSLTGKIAGAGYLAEGMAFIRGETKTIILTIVRHTNDNKVYLYYSLDNGVVWTRLMECTAMSLTISNTCGAETVAFLTFFLGVLYNNHMFTVETEDGGSVVAVDSVDEEDDEDTLISMDNADDTGTDASSGKKILGISITVDGTLYVLVEGLGVLAYSDFEPKYSENGKYIGRNPNMKVKGVAGWKDGYYSIDPVNIGSPYTAINQNININDDFDIDNEEMLKRIKSFYANKYKYIKTYVNANDRDGEISDDIWLWKENYLSSTGVILSESSYIIENMQNLRPNTMKTKKIVKLKITPQIMIMPTADVIAVENAREVKITPETCDKYIGWTRIIYDSQGKIINSIKITEDYLRDVGATSEGYMETWDIHFTKSEVYMKEIASGNPNVEPTYEEVYKQPEYNPSAVFDRYNKFNKSDESGITNNSEIEDEDDHVRSNVFENYLKFNTEYTVKK